jgi:ABC-2 type transport system permease protein
MNTFINRNLYRKELKRNKKNLTIWTSIVVGFTLMVCAIYPFMKDMGNDMALLMDKMPEELRKAMGMDEDTWSNMLGFYSTYYVVYIVILISIFTSSTGANLLSKEEREKTAEFLYTRPLSRTTLYYSKLIGLITLTFTITILQFISAWGFILIFTDDLINWHQFILMHLHGFFLIIFFTSIGNFIAMYVTPKRNFMGLVVGMTFGSYFIDAIGKSTDATKWLSYFSPFHYFEINQPTQINYFAILAFLLISAILVVVAHRRFLSKDIYC